MKRERPILFSTPMVQAILDGRKTMTRRFVKSLVIQHDNGITHGDCPYGKVGDVLYVRETWIPITDRPESVDQLVWYKADQPDADKLGVPWKSPLFMPKDAARINGCVFDNGKWAEFMKEPEYNIGEVYAFADDEMDFDIPNGFVISKLESIDVGTKYQYRAKGLAFYKHIRKIEYKFID
jgi:hypothetical protein